MTGPPPPESATALLARLRAAQAAAAALAGAEPAGVRAVEPAPGRDRYLCAFAGPAFLCLTERLEPEPTERGARETASAGLLWEHLEALVDAAALRELAGAVGRILVDPPGSPEVAAALAAVAARALELAAWREEPQRVVASVPALDHAIVMHERLMRAYGRFVHATEPLVAVQETLPGAVVAALREVEEAAGRAAAGERLADRLAGAVPECDEGAGQVVAAHLTRLREEAAGARH